MNSRTIGGWWAAAVMGALMTASLAVTADAQVLTPSDPPAPSASTGSAWYGYSHPGSTDPSDPSGNDWHCDPSGNWHNDADDASGHADGRCRAWQTVSP